MFASDSELESWTTQGAVQSAINSHLSIRDAVSNIVLASAHSIEVFLQGSYKNHTNIRGDSDVDVVVKLNEVFWDNLSQEQRNRLGIIPAQYQWTDFEADVYAALISRYGSDSVEKRNKSIKISFASHGYIAADVVVATEYRRYQPDLQDYVSGITFIDRQTEALIINYPKQHFENGNDKGRRTNGKFRRFVRLFKNARNRLIHDISVTAEIAPSYFLECLLYNLDDELFSADLRSACRNIVHVIEYGNIGDMLAQNGITRLFGYDSTHWITTYAVNFAAAMSNII